MLTIVAFAAVTFISCNSKKAPEIPEGTPIGNLKYFANTDDAGITTINFIKPGETGPEVVQTSYTKVEEIPAGFIVAHNADGKLNLLSLDGISFANASSYEVAPYFALTDDVEPGAGPMIVLTDVGNGNHLAYNIKDHNVLIQVSGLKETVIPLSNGITIFKKDNGWGFAKADQENPILEGLKAINVISVKGKASYWVQSADYTGIVDEEGNGVKSMNAKQIKKLIKNGKKLWEKDGVTGVLVKKL